MGTIARYRDAGMKPPRWAPAVSVRPPDYPFIERVNKPAKPVSPEIDPAASTDADTTEEIS